MTMSHSVESWKHSVERWKHKNSSKIREHDRDVFVNFGTEVTADTTSLKDSPRRSEGRVEQKGRDGAKAIAYPHDTSHLALFFICFSFPHGFLNEYIWPKCYSAICNYRLVIDRKKSWSRSSIFFFYFFSLFILLCINKYYSEVFKNF